MRIVVMIMSVLLTLLFWKPIGQAKPNVSADHAVLMEEMTGRVLFAKDAYERKPIASITKVMTAIIAIEQGTLSDKVKASRRAVYSEGSSIYLELGEKMSLEDLLYGLMLRSGNDAAVAIAEHIGGSVEGFVFLMNEKAKQLGMSDTNFTNPHGLHDDNHYSTAYDMALLMRYAIQNDTFQKISETSFHKPLSRTYGWKNKNRLVNGLYRYSTGGKTGFTKRAGRTLLTTAKKGDLNLIAVTLNAPDDWNDHINLYDWAFHNFYLEKLVSKGKVTYPLKDVDDLFIGYINEDVFYPISHNEKNQIKKQSYLFNVERENGIVGQTVFTLNDKRLFQVDIYNDDYTNHKNENSLFQNILKISGLY